MKYFLTHDGEEHEVEVKDLEDGAYEVTVGERTVRADFASAGRALYSLLLDDESIEVLVVRDGSASTVIHHGRSLDLKVESERERNARLISADGAGEAGANVYAVMPGIVVSVSVAEGDEVEQGQAVCVLEAMKMENEIRASGAGKVTRIAVSPGDTVNSGDLLIEIS